MDEDDCCWAIDNGDNGHAGVFNPELAGVGDNDVVVWIGVCHMTRSSRSTIVDREDGVFGGSPAGLKLWCSSCNGDNLEVAGHSGEGG